MNKNALFCTLFLFGIIPTGSYAHSTTIIVTSDVNVNGNLNAGTDSSADIGNVNLKNTDIKGNLNIRQRNTINGNIRVAGDSVLRHGAVVGKNSDVKGRLNVRTRASSENVTLKNESYANIGSVNLDRTTIGGGNINLSADTGDVRVDKGGKAYISAVDMHHAHVRREANISSRTTIGDVHVHRDGMLNAGSLKMQGGHAHSINQHMRLYVPEGVSVGRGETMEIGILEPK